MTTTFPTREAARRFELAAARGLAEHARERQVDLRRAVDGMLRALRDMHEAGASDDWFADELNGLHDEAANIDAHCLRIIDNAGETGEPVDLSEVDAMLASVS